MKIRRHCLWALLAGVFGFGMPIGGAYAQEGVNGETLFKRMCTTCHSADKVLAGVRKTPAPERTSRLATFLPTHFAPDAAQRKAIADYLLAEAAK
jgi:hypothetical protein